MKYLKFIYQAFLDWSRLKWDGFRLWVAIKMADAKQQAYNKRYYVLEDWNENLKVLNSYEIKELKKKRHMRKLVNGKLRNVPYYLMNPRVTHQDIMRECLYYTLASKNDEPSRMSFAEREKRKKKWLVFMQEYHNRQQLKHMSDEFKKREQRKTKFNGKK